MLPPDVLIHAPAYPNWPPGAPDPCVFRDDVFRPGVAPAFSIHLSCYNRQGQIAVTLTQLLKLTAEAWELVVVDDGSTDGSLAVIDGVLDSFAAGWPPCASASSQLDVLARWPAGSTAAAVGDLGARCVLRDAPPPALVRVRVVRTPGVFATSVNNLQMRLAHPAADFFVQVDDDQFMTTPAWNARLAEPARRYADVFSTSARCAHGVPHSCTLHGAKCTDSGAPHAAPWAFYVADSGNRGPLLIRAAMAARLGYLDEVNFAGVLTTNCDHDMNVRAYYGRPPAPGGERPPPPRWVSGYVPLQWAEEREGRSPTAAATRNATAAFKAWFEARRAAADAPPHLGHSGYCDHDGTRAL